MIYFRNMINNEVYAYDDDEQANLHTDDNFIRMSNSEVEYHINPEKNLSDEEKILTYRQNMPTLSPIEFDIKLNQNGLYDAVQELIKDNFELRIAYTRAIFFSRVDPFITQAGEALGLTPEQVDTLWTS